MAINAEKYAEEDAEFAERVRAKNAVELQRRAEQLITLYASLRATYGT